MKPSPFVLLLTFAKLALVGVAVVAQVNGHLSPNLMGVLAAAVAAFGLTSAVHVLAAPRQPSAALLQFLAAVTPVAQSIFSAGLGQAAAGGGSTPDASKTSQRGFVGREVLYLLCGFSVAGAFVFVPSACTSSQRSAVQRDVATARANVQIAIPVAKTLCLVGTHVPAVPSDVHATLMASCDVADDEVPAAMAILDTLDKLALSTAKPPAPAPTSSEHASPPWWQPTGSP